MPRLTFAFISIMLLLAIIPMPYTHRAYSDTTAPFTTIQVNSTDDIIADDGQCTLREAITAANTDTVSGAQAGECAAGGQSDFIGVPRGYYLLTLEGANEDNNMTGDLDVKSGVVKIKGAGSSQTIIDGMGKDRVFQTQPSLYQLELEELTVTNGRVQDNHQNYPHGGGIDGRGRLILRRVIVRNNHAAPETLTWQGGHGGGIYMVGSLLIEYSEISDNFAGVDNAVANLHTGSGGGIYVVGTYGSEFRAFLSTISGNYAENPSNSINAGRGGGIAIEPNYYLNPYYFISTTITNNHAHEGGGIAYVNQTSVFTLHSSILAGNEAVAENGGDDCRGSILSQGANIFGNTENCDIQVEEGDQLNVNPFLEPLNDNGSGRRTHALPDHSPAVDQGACTGELVDQRGYPRPVNHPTILDGVSDCDVGAYELNTLSGTPTVTSTPAVPPPALTPTPSLTPLPTATPTGSPTPLPTEAIFVNTTEDVVNDDGFCSLREAITAANTNSSSGGVPGECAAGSGDDTIIVPAGLYTLTREGYEESNIGGDLDIRSNITLLGSGATSTIIDATQRDRVLHILPGSFMVTIVGIAVTNGLTAFAEPGGGILINAGLVTIHQSHIHHNRTSPGFVPEMDGGDGGGIAVLGGQLRLTDSEVRSNQTANGAYYPYYRAGSGGGIYIESSATIIGSTIDGNLVGDEGPGTDIGNGGGIFVDGSLQLDASTVTNNAAAYVGGVQLGVGQITNSTMSGNRSFALYVGDSGTLEGIGMTIADNDIGILANGTTQIGNSLIDRNKVNCNGQLLSLGYNLFGNYTFCNITGDMTGTYRDVETGLGTLGDYGGTTQTYNLMQHSPAKDKGHCFYLTTDQRDLPRPVDLPGISNLSDGCDVGAFEVSLAPPPSPTATPSATATPPSQALFLPLIQQQ